MLQLRTSLYYNIRTRRHRNRLHSCKCSSESSVHHNPIMTTRYPADSHVIHHRPKVGSLFPTRDAELVLCKRQGPSRIYLMQDYGRRLAIVEGCPLCVFSRSYFVEHSVKIPAHYSLIVVVYRWWWKVKDANSAKMHLVFSS
jgi:hypothetical protein